MPSYDFQFKVIRQMDRIRGNDIVIFFFRILFCVHMIDEYIFNKYKTNNVERDNVFVSDQIIG